MKKALSLILSLLLFAGCASLPAQKPSPAAPPAPAPVPEEPAEVPAGPAPAHVAEQPVYVPPAEPHAQPKLPPPKPRPVPGSDAEEEKYVSLNFDNADIAVVIQTISELIGLNYIVSPGVKGRVTIQSSSKIPVSSLFTVLTEILDVNSLTAVRSGQFYKIVPTAQARQKDIETVVEGAAEAPAGQEIITRVVPLTYINPSEVVKVLNPLKSPAGLYYGHDPTRLLIMTDTANKVSEMMKIVELLDVDAFARIQVELYPVKYADVEELAKELTQVVTVVFTSSGRGRSVFRIIPVPQVSAIMIISGEPDLAKNIVSWVAMMDQPAREASEQIFIYHLSHAKAEEIASTLSQVFKTDGKGAAAAAAATTLDLPTPAAAPQSAAQARAQRARQVARQEAAAPAASLTGGQAEVIIVADKATNALVIQTAAWYYPVVQETIRKLDQMPKQVLIEVLIAEITLDDETQFGLQWVLRGQGSAKIGGETHNFNSQLQNTFGSSDLTLPGSGFSWIITEANRLSAVLNAFASAAKLNVLSSPHIIATDNMEAIINVGDEIPILRTQTTETAGGSGITGTVTNDVEYRDTGIILTVTPHINEGRYVTLDVKQEDSSAQTNTLGGTTSPIIRKRMVETTMVVKDDQTLVIGGLIEEQKDFSREGIPFLSKIPVLGYLFGATIEKVSKTELVLLITPRVIANPDDGARVSGMVRDRVLTLKEGIELFTNEAMEERRKEE